MFMFQTGLLATFIPEVLMVIGYLVCLFVSNPTTESNTATIHATVVQSASIERVQVSTYSVSTSDFMFVEQPVIVDVAPPLYCSTEPASPFLEPYFQLSGSLSYVQFSRPPPVFIV
jgi:hypothetical protein